LLVQNIVTCQTVKSFLQRLIIQDEYFLIAAIQKFAGCHTIFWFFRNQCVVSFNLILICQWSSK